MHFTSALIIFSVVCMLPQIGAKIHFNDNTDVKSHHEDTFSVIYGGNQGKDTIEEEISEESIYIAIDYKTLKERKETNDVPNKSL